FLSRPESFLRHAAGRSGEPVITVPRKIQGRGWIEESLSYSEFSNQIQGFKGALVESGLKMGDNIVFVTPESPSFFALIYAANAVGLRPEVFDDSLSLVSLMRKLRDPQLRAVVGSSLFLKMTGWARDIERFTIGEKTSGAKDLLL